MNNSRLFVSGIEVPLINDIAIAIDYLIADVKSPDTRDANFTKTVLLPATTALDKIFEFSFETNISLQTFNPNLKTPVSYSVNNTVVMSGNLQLTGIILNKKSGQVTYEVKIIGLLIDLFYIIGDKFLIGNDDPAYDLDFSEYDHILSITNILNTWDPAVSPNLNKVHSVDTAIVPGIGYRYPLIDYGYNNGNLQYFKWHGMRPGLFAYEYFNKILDQAGKTVSSNFLSSSFFKTLLIPCTEILNADATTILNRNIFVGQSGTDQNFNHAFINIGTPPFSWVSPLSDDIILLNDTTAFPFFDTLGQYNSTSGTLTINETNIYTIQADIFINTAINFDPFYIAPYVDSCNVNFTLYLDKFISGSWTQVSASNAVSQSGAGVNGVINELFSLTYTAYTTSGDQFRLRLENRISNAIIKDLSGTITSGSFSYDVFDTHYGLSPNTNATLKVSCSDDVFEGNTVVINNSIPRNIKKKDFIKGLINMFNLYMDLDKDDPNNYIIEPRDDFYTSDIVDWTDKLDISKDVKLIPIGSLNAKRFNYTYKDDSDYYNKTFKDSWNRTYGQCIFESENQFVVEDSNISILFSPCPLVGNGVNSLVIPKIYKNESGTVTPQKSNIKIIQYAGSIQIALGYWAIFNADGSIQRTFTVYPYAGHLDNPYSPTIDLCFDVPDQVYYTNAHFPLVYTENNLFNIYHSRMINEITNKNSQVMIAYFNLSESDIRKFDFKKKYLVDGTYYRVNAIKGFDILEPKTTQVELLKLLL